jgi:putative ABC transport system permease protein
MSFKKRYFRRLNCFTMRQLSSSVNTMVVSMTIICLLLFFTICGLSAAFSLRNSINSTIRENANVDWAQAIYVDEGLIDAMDGSTGRVYFVDEHGNVDEMYLDTTAFEGKTPYEIWQQAEDFSDESMRFVTEYVKKANNRDFFEKYGQEYMDCLSEYAIVSVYYAPGLTPKEVMGPGYDKLIQDNPRADISADYEIDHERIVKVS